MQVHRFECPKCRAALRLRTPLRSDDTLPCPDCGVPLQLTSVQGELKVLLGEEPPPQKPKAETKPTAPKAASRTRVRPELIARGVAGVLLLVLVVFLFWDRLPAHREEEAEQQANTIEVPRNPDSIVPSDPIAAGSGAAGGADTAPVNPAAPTSDADLVAATGPASETLVTERESSPAKQDEGDPGQQSPTAAIDPRREHEPGLDAAALREQARARLTAMIGERLQQRLVAFDHPEPVAIGTFLDEIQRFIGVPIDRTRVADEELDIQCALKECTIGDVLSAGLAQAGLTWEIRDGLLRVIPDSGDEGAP